MARNAEQIADEMRAYLTPAGREHYVYALGAIRSIVELGAPHRTVDEQLAQVRSVVAAVDLVLKERDARLTCEFGPDRDDDRGAFHSRDYSAPEIAPVPAGVDGTALGTRGAP